MSGRKYEAIDLMKLNALGSAKGWNDVLTDCHKKLDINRLAKIRYQIQAGMDDLAKLKLNTEDMCVLFVRLNRSLENTAMKILKIKYPLPHDNPLIAKEADPKALILKQKREVEFAKFMRDSAY